MWAPVSNFPLDNPVLTVGNFLVWSKFRHLKFPMEVVY